MSRSEESFVNLHDLEIPKYRKKARKRTIPIYWRVKEAPIKMRFGRTWSVFRRYVTLKDALKALKILNQKDPWFEYCLDPSKTEKTEDESSN